MLGILAAAACRVTRSLLRCAGGERGSVTILTGLIAVLATAGTAATISVASDGADFSGLEQLVDTSIQRVSGTLEVRGSVVARSENGTTVSSVQIPVRLYGESASISFAADDPERLTIAYYDDTSYLPDVPYTVQFLSGNGDDHLDSWETALIRVDFDALGPDFAGPGSNERFVLEMNAPVGGLVQVERRLPPILQAVMSLN